MTHDEEDDHDEQMMSVLANHALQFVVEAATEDHLCIECAHLAVMMSAAHAILLNTPQKERTAAVDMLFGALAQALGVKAIVQTTTATHPHAVGMH